MEKLNNIIEKNKEMAEPTLVVRKGNEMNEDLQESSCLNVGYRMNFVNEYIHVEKLKAQRNFVDQLLNAYDNEVLRVMKSEGCMSDNDYHYLSALKDVRNYLINQRIGINNRICEWNKFDDNTLKHVEKYINSFQNNSIIQSEDKGFKPPY